MEIHRSARKHGIDDDDVIHALENALVVYGIGEDEGPVRSLHLGPDGSGNLLEIVVLEFDDGCRLVIHAMRMRRRYQGMLHESRGGRHGRNQ